MKQAQTSEWQALPDYLQAALAREAMRRAALILADQAELFAAQFQAGVLLDRGGPDALTLFATLVRETLVDSFPTVGNA
jgi:hypothetical protein